MVKAWKDAVPVSIHICPEGAVNATQARIRQWAQKLKAMRAAGNKVPIPWGHNTEASPGAVEPHERGFDSLQLTRLNRCDRLGAVSTKSWKICHG
jgi:hypothetical protein